MHVRIVWGRQFQIRGARFEKQTEPDVSERAKWCAEDWFPLVSWEFFVRFRFLQMSCGAVPKWQFCTIRCRATTADERPARPGGLRWRAKTCSFVLTSLELEERGSLRRFDKTQPRLQHVHVGAPLMRRSGVIYRDCADTPKIKLSWFTAKVIMYCSS